MTAERLEQLQYLLKGVPLLEKSIKASNNAELTSILNERLKKCVAERNELEQYLAAIQEEFILQVFTLRFVGGLRWSQIAMAVGGNNTPASLRMMACRYMKNGQ